MAVAGADKPWLSALTRGVESGAEFMVRYPARFIDRSGLSGLVSVALHALLFALLMWHPVRPPGAEGASEGARIDLALVSAASLGLAAPHAAPMNAMITSAPPSPPSAVSAPAPVDEGETKAPLVSSDQTPTPPSSSAPQTVAWQADGASRISSKMDAERRGAEETAGGDPSDANALLIQIAKCLPPDLRPHLLAQRLVLKLSSGGALAAAPMIDSIIPLVTATERADADKVVQAALQCGPYAKAGDSDQVVSMDIDFSAIRSSIPARSRP
jgi:hypothetical protein